MTYRPHFNYPAFDAMKADLIEAGYRDIISPAELDDPADRAAAMASLDGDPSRYTGPLAWEDFLARDVKIIAGGTVDGIVVLPEWETSRGARLETFVGKALCGLPVYYFDRDFAEFGFVLFEVPDIQLYRAWTAEDRLAIAHAWEVPA
jgi:hypothetical protein